MGGTANVLDFAVMAGAPHVFTSTILPMEGEETTGRCRLKEVRYTYRCTSRYLQLHIPLRRWRGGTILPHRYTTILLQQ